jgi:parallel beta-helix repeat protein
MTDTYYTHNHLCFLVILLLSASFLAQLPQVRATVWLVPDDYPTIQEAVDMADPGDTIEVSPDVYHESVLVLKSLTIIGQDKYTTIVDGSESGYAFWLDTDGVTIRGFTVRDCSNYGVIAYYSGGHTIDDNVFINNAYGVYLSYSPSANDVVNNSFFNNDLRGINLDASSGNTISDNYISESTYGIKLSAESQFNSVANNTIIGTSHGIYLGSSPNNDIDQNSISSEITGIALFNSDHTNIQNNTLSDSAYGIEIYNCMYTTFFANTVSQNGFGAYVVYASTNTIDSNLMSNNDWGINLYDSDSNTIVQNTFSFNAYGIDITFYSTGNTIAWNNILNNTVQMHQDSTSGANTWNKMTGGKTYGNYWSNYTGNDTDEPPDGVGDTRIPHFGVDNYPLMNPWSTVHDIAVTSVATSDDTVYQGQTVNITVTVRNEGTATETVNVTARYFNRLIGTKEVANLPRLKTTTITFTWNTTSVPTGFNYEISAKAEPITGETDTSDNNFIDGTVTVKIPGDIDGDGDVDRYDFGIFAVAYGSSAGDLNYEIECDFDDDGDVDRYDFGIFSANYGKTC